LPAVPFSTDFAASLPLLEPLVHPKTPIYLLLRKTNGGNEVVAVTYIPSTALVRSKTLFASTRATLVKELGIEGGSLFATESAEILDPKEWEDRDSRDGAGTDEALLTREERELQGVKRAEDEERHGTKGRDLMGSSETSGVGGGSSVGVMMEMDDAGKGRLRELAQSAESEEGMVVQFVSFMHSPLALRKGAC
jgi:twinfilin-like protein